jgi:hypothetical protein
MPTKNHKSPIANFASVFKNRITKASFTLRFENGKEFYIKGDTIFDVKEIDRQLPTEFLTKAFFKRMDSRQC